MKLLPRLSAGFGSLLGLAALVAIVIAAMFFSTRSNQPTTTGPPVTNTTPPTRTSTTNPRLTPTLTFTPNPTPTVSSTMTPLPKPTITPNLTSINTPAISPTSPLTGSRSVPIYSFEVVKAYLHDPNAFTQGLIFEDGNLYEGTGRRGQSTLRQVDLATGQVLQLRVLPESFFGEGITIFGERLIQLTWQSHLGFVYDKDSFELLQQFTYPTEGWGITHDGQHLIMSDGTAFLYFLDPETFETIKRIEVTDLNGPVVRLNELEYIQGEIFANVWQTDWIARIDPDTGQVVGWIDLSGLLGPEEVNQPVDVLNGIAYDTEDERLFVTGKLWPKLFEVELLLNK